MDEDELAKELESKETDEKEEKELEVKEPIKVPDKKEDSLDIEALKKALKEEIAESLRTEEKAKLYDSLEKYKKDAKDAEVARKEAEDKLKEYETTKLTVEEQATLKLQQLEESNTKLQLAMTELVEEANNKISTLQLEIVKKEILAKYDDEIIPALVSGSTIEEIAESAEKAHMEYISIRDREVAKAKTVVKPKEKIGGGVNPQNDRLNVGLTVADINKIDNADDWYKNRDKFVEEALKS
jgi:hypothetical protein